MEGHRGHSRGACRRRDEDEDRRERRDPDAAEASGNEKNGYQGQDDDEPVAGPHGIRVPRTLEERQRRASFSPAHSSQATRSTRTPGVRRTLAISCEAVPAVSCRRGHEAAPLVRCSRNQPGAAESLVSFIALFGRPIRLLPVPLQHQLFYPVRVQHVMHDQVPKQNEEGVTRVLWVLSGAIPV